ncbi:MAG: cytochrome-c oxidase, cbb3-type subunit II [Sneathiellales bacterium]|nr:cytochrome-c oxidase, cbb3-type subunit II [Sneathiellales bacterium]
MPTSHQKLESHSLKFVIMILFVASIGGLVEIAPLFTIDNTIERVEGMRPYTPLELAGRDIYVREGCYACHSQMIRTMKSDIDRYGSFSLAAESMYDHPFQWGSKRTGPDLARVGGKYSDSWHLAHLVAPRDVVQGSVMPGYGFLAATPLDVARMPAALKAQTRVGVPYTAEQIEKAELDTIWQADSEAENEDALFARYGEKVNVRDFDGNKELVSEMDALIAYLQMLGTLVDVKALEKEDVVR